MYLYFLFVFVWGEEWVKKAMKKYQENFRVICCFFAYLNSFPRKIKYTNIQNKYKLHAKFLFDFI